MLGQWDWSTWISRGARELARTPELSKNDAVYFLVMGLSFLQRCSSKNFSLKLLTAIRIGIKSFCL